MDLVEDGVQEDRGRRDIQGRQVERRFIRPVRGRQNWLTQALRWAAAPSWRRMAETNHDGCEQECGCWKEGFADALEVWPESHWPGFALRQTDVL